MTGRGKQPILLAAGVIAVAWLLAAGGSSLARNSRMTAEKIRVYAQSVDLSKLTGETRAKAIREFAIRLNALSPEERRRARLERVWEHWLANMTEEEKSGFIEATMPTGFKQMLASFEKMSEDKRRRAIDDALKRLKESGDRMRAEDEPETGPGTGAPPDLSEELQQKVATVGLKTFYSESSAQTKAEMAPLLEELQRMMESGRMFRSGR